MKASRISVLAVLTHRVFSQAYGIDPRGAKDCVTWVDVGLVTDNNSCEATLREWGVEPERFHAWNPAVGLDCKPWLNYTSYCVMTNETLDNAVYYTTTTISDYGYTVTLPLFSMTTDSAGYTIPVTKSDATIRPYTTIPAIQTPSAWKDMGCFINSFDEKYDINANRTWPLDYRFATQDPEETIDKCKQKCWEMQFHIAAVKMGDECWCGDKNNNTRAQDQGECNTPCAGDSNVMCGSDQRMNVWAAEAATAGTLTSASGSADKTGAGEPTATASSGARRNRAFFGFL